MSRPCGRRYVQVKLWNGDSDRGYLSFANDGIILAKPWEDRHKKTQRYLFRELVRIIDIPEPKPEPKEDKEYKIQQELKHMAEVEALVEQIIK